MSYHGRAVVKYNRCYCRKDNRFKQHISRYPGIPNDWKTSRRKKFYIRQTNKIVRVATDVPNGSRYKRYFDLWWTLY